jgi:hypothetical protein
VLKKISNYGKYRVLTAIGDYLILNLQKVQAAASVDPGTGF